MGRLNPLLGIGIIVFCIFFYFALSLSYLPHFCIFEELLSFSCPFCNLTKAFEQLFLGNLKTAILTNPFCIIVPLYFLTETYFKYSNKLKSVRVLNKLFGLSALFNLLYINY
jgi:hypothetical protein